jgi:hypothetical protein
MNSRGSKAIQVFVFPKIKHKVREVIDKHGNPWWVARDVYEVLGIDNPSQALSRLDDDEKNTIILNESNRGNPKNDCRQRVWSLLSDHDQPKAGGQGVQAVGNFGSPTVNPKTGSYGHNSQP